MLVYAMPAWQALSWRPVSAWQAVDLVHCGVCGRGAGGGGRGVSDLAASGGSAVERARSGLQHRPQTALLAAADAAGVSTPRRRGARGCLPGSRCCHATPCAAGSLPAPQPRAPARSRCLSIRPRRRSRRLRRRSCSVMPCASARRRCWPCRRLSPCQPPRRESPPRRPRAWPPTPSPTVAPPDPCRCRQQPRRRRPLHRRPLHRCRRSRRLPPRRCPHRRRPPAWRPHRWGRWPRPHCHPHQQRHHTA